MPPGQSAAEKALLVREHSEKTVRQEMEGVPPSVPYTVLELIGKGSFGSVFKAIHNDTKQLFAVKSLDLDQHDDEIKDIQKEIALLSHLKAGDAPNITAYHGSYQLGARLWVVMDLCSGGSMRTLMKAGPIEEKFITIVIRETLTALAFLHKNGIIHRDIKAANILVGQDGRVQLCDFGVSAQIATKNGKRQTFVGTPQWMAPEALTGGLYDSRVDIWSFGITVIEMAKQNPPHHQIHPQRVVDMIPRLPPPRLEGGTWSNALREFVALCLCEIPEQRAAVEDLQRTKLVKNAKAPVSVMRELITRYEIWEKGGGVRGSMLYGIGMAGNEQNSDESTNDPGWDFDTIKSRASGVPKEWNMISRHTIKPPHRQPRPRGAEGLYRLFENPEEESKWAAEPPTAITITDPMMPLSIGSSSPQPPDMSSGGGFFINIPEFGEDGLPISEPPPPPPRTPSPVGVGMIHMPTEEEMMQMVQQKVAAPPPSAPLPSQDPPTNIRTRPQRAGSAGASTLQPVELGLGSPRQDLSREPSPRSAAAIPASAPSSPPRAQNQYSAQTMQNKSYHLPSKSVPNLARRHDEVTPPVPALRGLSKARSAESTPPPHSKSRSHDTTLRARAGGRMPTQRPSNLNLGPPNSSNFNSRMQPPSPSRLSHTPQHSATFTNGSLSAMGLGPGQRTLPESGGIDFPHVEPLDAGVLSASNGLELAREMDRILTGLGDGLEVVEVGLKRLQTERKQRVPVDVEE